MSTTTDLSRRVTALEARLAELETDYRAALDGDRASVVDVALELARRRSLRPRERPSDGPVGQVRRQVVQWVALLVVGVLGAAGVSLARSCGAPSIAPPPVAGAGSGAPP
jgi:hypothetical protein